MLLIQSIYSIVFVHSCIVLNVLPTHDEIFPTICLIESGKWMRNLRILNSFATFFINSLIKFFPWLVNIALDAPNIQTNLSTNASAIVSTVWFDKGIQNLISWSCNVNIFVFSLGFGKDPTISIITLSNEDLGVSVIITDCGLNSY